MATIVIKNLPDAAHDRLKRLAIRNNRSVNKEVVNLIQRAVATPGRSDAALTAPVPQLLSVAEPAAPAYALKTGKPDGREALRAALVRQADGSYLNVLGIEDSRFFEIMDNLHLYEGESDPADLVVEHDQ
jgi:plasmid stability protein